MKSKMLYDGELKLTWIKVTAPAILQMIESPLWCKMHCFTLMANGIDFRLGS